MCCFMCFFGCLVGVSGGFSVWFYLFIYLFISYSHPSHYYLEITQPITACVCL